MTAIAAEAPRVYPTFRYRDASKMIDWLQTAFGFTLRVKYGEGNDVHHAELALHDTDDLCERASAAGATILEGPVDRDYGSREFMCRDPEGNVWSFGTYWPKVGEKPL